MDLEKVKAEHLSAYELAKEAMDEKMEEAENFDELLDEYEEKSAIDTTELLWSDAADARFFSTLEKRAFIANEIVSAINEAIAAGGDDKKKHRFKKKIEELVSDLRGIKRASAEIVENEQALQKDAVEALKLLDEMRGKR
ncbi:MAG: hypothetical protein IJS65_07450, partial [Clostridia bacterium]|nr:hypothetical protein [Clostridia bacterium]